MEGRVVTRLQKWGNGLGLRVPKSLAAEAKVGEGSSVELSPRRALSSSAPPAIATRCRSCSPTWRGVTSTGRSTPARPADARPV